MKKIFSFLIIISMLAVPVMAAAPQDIAAPSAILIEQSSGRVLFERGADIKRPIASVTKIMTALLVMEKIDSGEMTYEEMVTTSEKAFSMGGSQIFLEVGEKMSVHDLLKGLMVASGNDAAVALAEHVAGSHDEFVALMNERAKELGCENSNFVNTNGLPDDNHYSSARDLALISKELLTKHPDITKYSTIWMDSLRNGEFELANTNKLIYYYKGMTGLKTGFTSDAGHCLAGSATKENLNLITVILGAPSSDERFSDARKLLDYGFNNFVFKEGIKKGDVLKTVEIRKGKEEALNLVAEKDFSLLDDKNSKTEIKKEFIVEENITAPVSEGQILGTMIYKKGEEIVGEVNMVAEKKVLRKGFFDHIKTFFAKWLGV